MKKKLMAVLLTSVLAIAGLTACGGSSDAAATAESTVEEAAEEATEEAAEEATEEVAAEADFGDLVAEYDPEPGYDLYTLTEYTIEDAGATFVATVSKKSDNSAYFIHCNFYGDEQAVELDGDLNVISDKTGFMETDSPLIVEQAESENNWAAIG